MYMYLGTIYECNAVKGQTKANTYLLFYEQMSATTIHYITFTFAPGVSSIISSRAG